VAANRQSRERGASFELTDIVDMAAGAEFFQPPVAVGLVWFVGSRNRSDRHIGELDELIIAGIFQVNRTDARRVKCLRR
jgi:hypothetical protein